MRGYTTQNKKDNNDDSQWDKGLQHKPIRFETNETLAKRQVKSLLLENVTLNIHERGISQPCNLWNNNNLLLKLIRDWCEFYFRV